MKAQEYFPHRGDRSYAVTHYDLTLSYDVDTNQLRGKAVLSAEAASDLRELRLDLVRAARHEGHRRRRRRAVRP